VIVLDSLVRGHREAVDTRALLIEGEVGDPSALDRALPGCDAVMHIAGRIEVAESQADPGAYFDANVSQPARLLDGMLKHGVKAIVFSSTAAVYGEPAEVPIAEDAPTHPVNVYGATKLMFERLLDWYGKAHELRSVRLRYFNVAGAMPDASLGEAHHPETHIIPRLLLSLASGTRGFEVLAVTTRPRMVPASAITSMSATWPRPTCSPSSESAGEGRAESSTSEPGRASPTSRLSTCVPRWRPLRSR
jgi:UDP-glucose 4-epimerase